MPAAAKPSKRAKRPRKRTVAELLADMADRLARMEQRLDVLAQAREDADDVAAVEASRAEAAQAGYRPWADVKAELGA